MVVIPDVQPVLVVAPELIELGCILGRDLVASLVEEARLIRRIRASTHIDVRLHFHNGQAARADWRPVRAVLMGGDWDTP